MQDRSKKNSLELLTDVFEQDTDVTVRFVSQYSHRNKETEKGFCMGLSTIHLLEQLQSNKCIAINPFDNSNQLQEARDMQINYNYHCEHDHMGILSQRDFLETKLSLMDKKERDTIRYMSSYAELENKLKNKIQKTKIDGMDRGIYICETVNWHPMKDKKLDAAGHGISMTIQKQDNKLFSTGLDSNLFFAVGKGETGSNKVARKVMGILEAYDATEIYTYTNKKRS
jgi:hypothetical protein